MQSVGEKLRKAREEKGLSLDDVYRQTRIHLRVLEALEQDRAHNFLSFIYIKGFLRTYARYLKLDGEGLVREYISSQKIDAAAEPEIVLEKKRKFPFQINRFLTLRMGLTFVLALGLIFYFRYVLKNISSVGKKAQIQKVEVKVVPLTKAQAEDLILEVRTKDSCWLRVVADNQSIFEKTLPKGRRERWQAKDRIELRIGKPEALKVFVNGKPVDLKKARVKKGLVITHEGIVGK